MSWIILIKKLPTDPSPPKLSLHWAVPWPDDTWAKKQANTCSECGFEVTRKKNKYYDPVEDDPSEEWNLTCDCEKGPTLNVTPEDREVVSPIGFYGQIKVNGKTCYIALGKEHNWTGAVKINYKQEDIRCFPDEFNYLSAKSMREYINSGSHELVVSEHKPTEQVYDMIMNTDQRLVYEAALLDGASHNQAIMTAASGQIFVDEGATDIEFPVLGWYRCIPEYAGIFCDEWEMKE